MNRNILIFDDEKDILDICTIILEGKGYKVFTSTSCKNLFEIISNAAPSVIVMDNKIPDIGGVMAIQQIKSDPNTMNIPVIFFSANAHISVLSAQAGADHFLQKPFDLADFEDMLDKTADNNLHLSKTV